MFKRILLAGIVVVCFSLSVQAQVRTTKLDGTPIWNDVDAYISATQQTAFGDEATMYAILRDIKEGHCTFIPKGTRVNVVERVGGICFLTVEGFAGFFCTDCDLLKK